MSSIRIFGYLIIFAIVFLSLELVSFGAIYFLQNKYNSLIYDPSIIVQFNPEKSENYSAELGWITQIGERDEIGARINHDIYDSSCIDMFGDSFTYSDEVSKEFAWPNQLSKLLGCKVNNFGVGGYGSDQATLRHELTSPYSKVSVLNHLSENITRNVNQFRNLLYPRANGTITTKPRYILTTNDQLLLIEKPALREDDLFNLKLLRIKLKNEYFFPDGESGIKAELTFPYLLSAVDLIRNHFHIKSKVSGRTRHSEFYDYTHPSNALNLTSKIFDKFINNSESRDQLAIITVIPTCRDLEEFNRFGSIPYQSLLDDLNSKGILYHDFINDFLREPDFYKFFNSCSAHPNKEGYGLIARSFANFVYKNDFISKSSVSKEK